MQIKRYLCGLLALMMLVTLCACGDDVVPDKDKDKDKTTTSTTVEGEGTTSSVDGDSTTTSDTAGDSTTTTYRPSGATIPIGTKPSTGTVDIGTTTTTGEPTGSTTSTDGSATSTTTTTTTTKPSEPEVPQRYIALPEIGSDIDVTNKKDRIRVSAASAFFEESGEITVTLTFRNYSGNWITEETNYVQYTCYAEDGSVTQRAQKLLIGVIDTKKNVEKSFTFTVPADTAEVRITKSSIVYWTEWA